jgi:hypothetical protein
MTGGPTFEQLLAEGGSVPLEGWDFSWFEGRATEERPQWGYSRLLGERMARAAAGLDIQTGGGEVLARIPRPPPVLVATESWPPNVEVARRNLRPLGAAVVAAGLAVADLREQALRVEFHDVGAVVHFLRKVPWTVPGFTVVGYADQLARMHRRIRSRGPFVSHAQRFLIEARKPR